jgi:3-hydroxymyristoyl/3-hydroxydecanoyl-(acyl carrier protein) dehydratase
MEDSVLEYIPQRPPFVMVDSLLFCNSVQTKTKFTVREDNLFVVANRFTEMGILENIAQTCATRLGYLNKRQPVKIGMIGSVDNFEVQYLPFIGEEVITTITITTEILNIVLFSATVLCGEIVVASCNMKVVLTDIVSEG